MNDNKNYLDGIKTPAQKRSIKDIPVPTRKRIRPSSGEINLKKKITLESATSKKDLDLREEFASETVNHQNKKEFFNEPNDKDWQEELTAEDDGENERPRGKKMAVFGVAGLVVIIALFFAISALFSKATVVITPKQNQLANLNIEIPIINDSAGNDNLLNYKIMEVTESASRIVDSENEETVERKASGIITISNEYSKTEQRLIQNTRFETREGLIYRIKDSISVPGYTENAGKIVAGTIDVEVFADEPGEKYNIGKTTFKIPGFKGQEQYESFFANSKTEMTGGFVGKQNTVTEETLETNVKAIQGQLTEKILNKIKEQDNTNYEYVYSPTQFVFTEPIQKNASQGDKVEISISGTAKIFVINKDQLAYKISEKSDREFDGNPVMIGDSSNLNLSIENNSDDEDSDNDNPSSEVLNVKGDAYVIWKNDLDALRKDLSGKSKKELNAVVSGYPGISKASATMRLIWQSNFPENPERIEIIEE